MNAKPPADDLDDLPPPRAARAAPGRLSNLLWLASGVLATAATLTSPGCMTAGAPAVSAKADVSVKETMLVARAGTGGAGGNGAGELTANISFAVSWPGGKGK